MSDRLVTMKSSFFLVLFESLEGENSDAPGLGESNRFVVLSSYASAILGPLVTNNPCVPCFGCFSRPLHLVAAQLSVSPVLCLFFLSNPPYTIIIARIVMSVKSDAKKLKKADL